MPKPLSCIIVDDEEGAHLVIGHYLEKMTTLCLSGGFYNAIEAMNFLYKHHVDLIFLDINMPGMSGLEMLSSMSKPPLVILTTAYSQYALESYKYQVVDYLVKPIEFPRFMTAVDHAFNRLKPAPQQTAIDQSFIVPAVDHLMLKVEGDFIRVIFDDILYVKSWGNYVQVHTGKHTYLSPITTTEIEHKLDRLRFIRIHKSYIVALSRIQKIAGGQLLLENDFILPIGNTFRRELLERFR
ncbi:LytR/AlgR family response regulator transcription factor [Pedobacter steynii]|uniref:DNA-binding response regulator n=1 Tax=Pedobacter steynii TaxID=430522 RepID=A0A1D7QL59_9SPHI|nr:LytTR family DNA-binding domain-containing protein [Pedobacter steynii]AOM79349.1 DNA-binding response regulator [Pedobacter steynii]